MISLSPGWTWTGLTGAGKGGEKPAGAWTAQETVLYMVHAHFGSLSYWPLTKPVFFFTRSTSSVKASSTSSSRITRLARSSINCVSCGPRETLQKAVLLLVVGTRITRPCLRSIFGMGWLSLTEMLIVCTLIRSGEGKKKEMIGRYRMTTRRKKNLYDYSMIGFA